MSNSIALRTAFGLAASLSLAIPAFAAELPSRNAKPPSEAKTATCEIDGKPGLLTSDGTICVLFRGYFSGAIEGGNVK